ncbi:hypothetical protein BC497_29580 (plasmid) [Klebsiella variicola]|nr:hypothetical protein BC497_29580 [Klebsiella variicola]
MPCVLKTKLVTEYQGPVLCQIDKDIYSDDASTLLLRRGSMVTASRRMCFHRAQRGYSLTGAASIRRSTSVLRLMRWVRTRWAPQARQPGWIPISGALRKHAQADDLQRSAGNW